jgi:ribosome maturation factor RimP
MVSHEAGTILDVEEVIPGGKYTLEVSSPGVERKLTKPADFQRFLGQKAKVVLREPVENQRSWVGTLSNFENNIITLEPQAGKFVQFGLDQVQKANLKFEW